MKEAFELEDIVKCRQLRDYTPRVPTRSPLKKAVWFYKCALRANWHRVRGGVRQRMCGCVGSVGSGQAGCPLQMLAVLWEQESQGRAWP